MRGASAKQANTAAQAAGRAGGYNHLGEKVLEVELKRRGIDAIVTRDKRTGEYKLVRKEPLAKR